MQLEVNDDLKQLLENWDTTGEWEKWGLFKDDADDELVFKALGSAWLFVQNNEPKFTAAEFGAVLQNADDWNAFYKSIKDLAEEVLPKQLGLSDPDGKLTCFILFSDKFVFRNRS